MARVAAQTDHRAPAEAQALVSAIAAGAGRPSCPSRTPTAACCMAWRPRDGAQRFPVTLGEAALGWVSGPSRRAHGRAAARSPGGARKSERKALGAEVLHLYREINLIYSFSEKLAALLDVERVARLTLQEARHLIVATDGMLMLLDEARADARRAWPAFGDEMPALPGYRHRPGHRRHGRGQRASARSSTTSSWTRAASRATRRSAR